MNKQVFKHKNIFEDTISQKYVLDEAKERNPDLNDAEALRYYIELQYAIEAQVHSVELSRIAVRKRLVAQSLIQIYITRNN